MQPTGTQIIAELIECSKDLNNKKFLAAVLEIGIKQAGLTLRSLSSHEFSPVGLTVIAVISESHVAIHTYPEAHHASVDIFTCSPNQQKSLKLFSYLRSQLRPKTIKTTILARGKTLDILNQNWITSPTSYGLETKYHIKRKIFEKKTKYQNLLIIENDQFGRMLFLDNDIQGAEKDLGVYDQYLVDPLIQKKKLNKVGILGGGDGGVLHRLLQHRPKSIFLVEIDRDVIDASKKFLPRICKDSFGKAGVTIVIDDANQYLEYQKDHDALIYDLTMHPESIVQKTQKDFLNEICNKIWKSLRKNGLISMQCCSEFDTQTIALIKNILPKYFRNERFIKSFIPSYCENWVFASAERKG